MRNTIVSFLAAGLLAATAVAQTSQLPEPSPIEKQLAARASDVTEVTLGKNMLAFAAKVLDGNDKDDQEAKKLIKNLDGIYVRSYEFDKEGQVSPEEVEQLRKYFETSEWSSIVKSRERRSGESVDVMVKLVNGESHGVFVLASERRELTIVLILGPINPDQLRELEGFNGLGVLGDVVPDGKDKEKDKEKHSKDGGKE